MNTEPWDVIIIGAGIVGASCAAACAREGLKVAVIEGAEIGGGATAEGMGHLVVLDDTEAQIALSGYSRKLWDVLGPKLPKAADFDKCGTIWVAADDEEISLVQPKAEIYAREGIRTETLDAEQLYKLEPNLRPGLSGGMLVPDDCVVYPPVVCAWMLEQVKDAGGTVIRERAESIESNGFVRLVSGSNVSGKTIVNAAGIHAPKLSPGIPVEPKKGHLVITDRYPGFVNHQLIELGYLKKAHDSDCDSVAFNVQPRPTGQLLIGSSRQFGNSDRQVDRAILGDMIDAAVAYLPDLADLNALRCWTGFRAATPDNLPLIGPWPEQEQVLLATGHEGLGITTSLATAELIVAHITGKDCEIPCAPFLPTRKFEVH